MRTTDPRHYDLLKRSAQRFNLRTAAKRGLAYRPFRPDELDELASWGTPYFHKAFITSRIRPPHTDCECERCEDAKEKRMRVAACRAARRAVCEYWRQDRIDGAYVDATDNDTIEALFGAPVPVRESQLPAMLETIGNPRYAIIALSLANGRTWTEAQQDAGYKSQNNVAYAIKRIRERLADYRPESNIQRAVREALQIFTPKPIETQREATLRMLDLLKGKRDDADDWQPPKAIRPVATGKIDKPIHGEPQRPMPETWARQLGFACGEHRHNPQLPIMPQAVRLSDGRVLCGAAK